MPGWPPLAISCARTSWLLLVRNQSNRQSLLTSQCSVNYDFLVISVLHECLCLAMDMLYSFLFPLKNHVSSWRSRIKLWTGLCWVVAALISIPHLFFWDIIRVPREFMSNEQNTTDYQCVIANTQNVHSLIIYQIAHIVLVFYLPCGIIVSAYIVIAVSLFR